MDFERIDREGIVFSKVAKNTPVNEDAVARCKKILKHVKKGDSVYKECSGYNYKHWVEAVYPPYVSKGDFIKAAYDLGFGVYPYSNKDFTDAYFNFTTTDFRLGQIKADCGEDYKLGETLKNDLLGVFINSVSNRKSIEVKNLVRVLYLKGWDVTEKDIYAALGFGKHDDGLNVTWPDETRKAISLEELYDTARINLDISKLNQLEIK